MKTPKTYIKTFFKNCILKNNSLKTPYTNVKNLLENMQKTMEGIRGAAENLSYFPLS